MKRVIALVLCILGFTISGCAKSHYNYYPEEKIINYGDAGEVKTVLAGNSIMHSQKETLTDVLNVPRHIAEYNIEIPKGRYMKIGEDSSKIYFESTSDKGRPCRVDGMPQVAELVYKKSDGKIYPDAPGMVSFVSFEGARIEKNVSTKQTGRDYYFKSLDYGGSKGKYVTFIFKEGPAENRITHDASQSKMFSYNGAQIEIINYDPDTLTCKIISPFDVYD